MSRIFRESSLLDFMKLLVIVTEKVGRLLQCNEIYSINYTRVLGRNNFSYNSFFVCSVMILRVCGSTGVNLSLCTPRRHVKKKTCGIPILNFGTM